MNLVGENSDSGDKSIVFYVIKLYRQELPGKHVVKGGEVVSKFTIVDLCGAEVFMKDSKKLVLKEGMGLCFDG